jgi:hypothetical protein
MKRFKVTKKQLNEYIERKKAEKVFYSIVEDLHKNAKFLNENVSLKKANQSVIDNYKRKDLITLKVQEMLSKSKIIGENWEII